MASPARRDPTAPPQLPDRTSERPAGDVDSAAALTGRSDARRLQAALKSRLEPSELPARWSRRRTLVFVVVASVVLWALIVAGAVLTVRLVSG